MIRLVLAITPILSLLPRQAHAVTRTMPVDLWYGDLTIADVLDNLGGVLLGTGYFVCAAIFVTGAFFYIASAGSEDRKGYGKGMMIGAAIGAAIITGARGIMNTVLIFIYG